MDFHFMVVNYIVERESRDSGSEDKMSGTTFVVLIHPLRRYTILPLFLSSATFMYACITVQWKIRQPLF